MLKYAYNTLVYGEEPISRGIERIARFGYDAVELVGEPTTFDLAQLKRDLAAHEIPASSIISIFTPERDLISSDPDIRRATVAYTKKNVDFAAEVGAGIVTLTPQACMKIIAEAPREQEWAWAVEGAREIAQYAGDKGVTIVVEPWNRYECYLINRLEQSIAFVDEVGLDSIRCMADTFHMSIEDRDIADAIRAAGSRLAHVHLADSNRAAPGRGHLDFKPIVEALRDIQFTGYASFELLPAAGDVFGVLKGGKAPEFFDQYTEESIRYMKKVEADLGLAQS
jgi:sugar phosphate isomerase/epimerase